MHRTIVLQSNNLAKHARIQQRDWLCGPPPPLENRAYIGPPAKRHSLKANGGPALACIGFSTTNSPL